MITVREPVYDDKQEKRARFMKMKGIEINKTLCLLNSVALRKESSDTRAAE